MRNFPTQEILRERFDYLQYGNFKLLIKVPRSSQNIGDHTCNKTNSEGYVYLQLAKYGVLRRADLIWIWHNGDIPEGYLVDHINKKRHDDRIENLRLLKKGSRNLQNMSLSKRNKTGIMGVYERNGRFIPHMKHKYKNIKFEPYSYDNLDDAVLARCQKEIELNWKGLPDTTAYQYCLKHHLI